MKAKSKLASQHTLKALLVTWVVYTCIMTLIIYIVSLSEWYINFNNNTKGYKNTMETKSILIQM